MSFWILSLALAALVAASLALALVRTRHKRDDAALDVQVYKDQLAEVDRDLARGVIGAEEAGRSRIEVSRRLLEADRASRTAVAHEPAARNSPLLAVSLGLTVVVAAFGIYLQLGAPFYPDQPLQARIAAADKVRAERIDQDTAEAQMGAPGVDPGADPEHLKLMERLRTALKDHPDDLQGYLLLARNEAALGNFAAARKAQARVIELKGDEAVAEDYATYAYLQIAAAGGYVSPQAEAAMSEALQRDPGNRLARFYSGVMFAQIGRPDMTYKLWRPLLDDAPQDDPFAPAIRADMPAIAAAAGIRYDPPAETAGPAGPSAEDMAAAAGLSGQERQDMIRSMVEGLSDRLTAVGGPPEEWAQLITALGVLGETKRAGEAWRDAQQAFAAAPASLAPIRQAAEQAGVLE